MFLGVLSSHALAAAGPYLHVSHSVTKAADEASSYRNQQASGLQWLVILSWISSSHPAHPEAAAGHPFPFPDIFDSVWKASELLTSSGWRRRALLACLTENQ